MGRGEKVVEFEKNAIGVATGVSNALAITVREVDDSGREACKNVHV